MNIKQKSLVSNGISATVQMFSPADCLAIVDWVIKGWEPRPGLVHTHQEASRTSLRRCTEYPIDPHAFILSDGSTVAQKVYEAFNLGNIWGLEYLEVPSIRVMAYEAGDGYGKHTDWSNGSARERKLSMTCQLTAENVYTGGDVVLYAGPEPFTISRSQGAATVWPSWTLHEVLPLERGVRYSLTAWAHGEEFR